MEDLSGSDGRAVDASVERGFVGALRARDVSVRFAGVGAVAAARDVQIQYGGCGAVAARGNVSLTNAGCSQLITAGGVQIERGGVQSIFSLGPVTLGERSFAGVVLSPAAKIEEGAKVLLTLPQAAALGAAFGLVFGLLSRIRPRS